MSSFIRRVAMLSGLSLFILTVQAGEPNRPARLALVIGNAAYAEKPLKNPVNDAKDMAKVLEGLGFQVILKTDVNLRTMRDAVQDFARSLSNGDVSLFYFAGHGNQYNGNNYLIPLESKIPDEKDFEYEALSVMRILEEIEMKNKEGVNIVILDACRSNPFGGRRFRGSSNSKGLTLMGSPSGSLIVYATAPNEVADDNPAERNGIYTKHLLAVLRETPQENIFTLLTKVRQLVFKETQGKQIPREENSLMVSEFCLAAGGCERVAKQPPVEVTESTPSQLPTIPQATVVTTPASTLVDTRACSLNIPGMHFVPGTVCRDKLKDGSLGPEMVIIPAGTFRMGDVQGTDYKAGYVDEQPVHEVSVKAYAMGKYEVTVAEFRRFVQATSYKTEVEQSSGCWIWTGKWKPATDKNWRETGFDQSDKSPVVCVNWNDATQYTKWLSEQTGEIYRLPTEAEWEYATRAGTQTDYYWGNTVEQACDYANVSDNTGKEKLGLSAINCEDGYVYTAPVGSYKPNSFGLYDTAGNVWEWTCSIYRNTYQGAEQRCTDKNDSGVPVSRGGSWINISYMLRSANRNFDGSGSNAANGIYNGGFRLARKLD